MKSWGFIFVLSFVVFTGCNLPGAKTSSISPKSNSASSTQLPVPASNTTNQTPVTSVPMPVTSSSPTVSEPAPTASSPAQIIGGIVNSPALPVIIGIISPTPSATATAAPVTGSYNVLNYNFSLLQGVGAIGNLSSAGQNTLQLPICPLGFDSAIGNIVVQDPSGAFEVATVSSTTCTGTALPGQVVVTTANAHSSGWSVQSASTGLAEALEALPSTGGTVFIPSGTTCWISSSQGILMNKPNTILTGQDWTSVIKERNGVNGSFMLWVSANAPNSTIKNLRIDGNRIGKGSTEVSGAGLVVSSKQLLIEQVEVTGIGEFGMEIGAGANGITITDNYFHDIGGIWDANGAGCGILSVWGNQSNPRPTNILIENNLFKDIHNTVISAGASGAFGLEASNVVINHNSAIDNFNNSGGMMANVSNSLTQDPKWNWVFNDNIIKSSATTLTGNTSGLELNLNGAVVSRNYIQTSQSLNKADTAGVIIEAEGNVPGDETVDSFQIYANIIDGFGDGVLSVDDDGGYSINSVAFDNFITNVTNPLNIVSPQTQLTFYKNILYADAANALPASGQYSLGVNTTLNVSQYGSWLPVPSGAIGTSSAQARVDSFMRLYLSGGVNLNSNQVGGTVFSLPSGIPMPYQNTMIWAHNDADLSACELEVTTTGSVLLKTTTCSLGSLNLNDVSFWLVADPFNTGLPAGTPVVTKTTPGCDQGQCLYAQGSDLCLADGVVLVNFVTADWSAELGTASGTCSGLGTEMLVPIPANVLAIQGPVIATVENSKTWGSYPVNLKGYGPQPPQILSVAFIPATQSIQAQIQNGASNCSVNLYSPDGSKTLATINSPQVTCSATQVSFQIPGTILMGYQQTGINFNVTGNTAGNGSAPAIVQFTGALIPQITSAGLGCAQSQCLWIAAINGSSNCLVGIYAPDWSSLLATVTPALCVVNGADVEIPAWIQQKYSAVNINFQNVNNGTWSAPYLVQITP